MRHGILCGLVADRGPRSGCLDPRLIRHRREVKDLLHVAGELVKPGFRPQVEYAVDRVRLGVLKRMAQLTRGQKERRVDAAVVAFTSIWCRRSVQQKGADIVPCAIAQGAGNMGHQLGEVRAATAESHARSYSTTRCSPLRPTSRLRAWRSR